MHHLFWFLYDDVVMKFVFFRTVKLQIKNILAGTSIFKGTFMCEVTRNKFLDASL